MKNGLYVIGKLRNDADLRWAYTGAYSGRGRPKVDSGEDVYTARVYSKFLKCWVRIVMLWVQRGEKTGMALLFSTDTDTDTDAMTILRYYKARFQIEATG